MNIKKYFSRSAVFLSVLTAAVAAQAQSASVLPASFSTDLAAGKSDIMTVIGGLATLFVVVLVWRYVKRAG